MYAGGLNKVLRLLAIILLAKSNSECFFKNVLDCTPPKTLEPLPQTQSSGQFVH